MALNVRFVFFSKFGGCLLFCLALKVAVRNRTKNALPPLLDRIAYLGLRAVSPLVLPQGLRITIAKLGYMGSFVSRANPDFCRTVLRFSDSIVTNTAHYYLRNII